MLFRSLLRLKFFAEVGIVEARILAPSQVQQLLLRKRYGPWHLAPAITVPYPGYGIRLITLFGLLHLPFTQLRLRGDIILFRQIGVDRNSVNHHTSYRFGIC